MVLDWPKIQEYRHLLSSEILEKVWDKTAWKIAQQVGVPLTKYSFNSIYEEPLKYWTLFKHFQYGRWLEKILKGPVNYANKDLSFIPSAFETQWGIQSTK